MTFRDFIKEKRDDFKLLKDEKNGLLAQKDKIMETINALTAERDGLRKSLAPGKDSQDPASILKAVEDMQKRYETTTLKPAEEKKMLADIKKMKESIPNANRILELKPKIDDLFSIRNELND